MTQPKSQRVATEAYVDVASATKTLALTGQTLSIGGLGGNSVTLPASSGAATPVPGNGLDLVEGADFSSDGHSYGLPGAGGTNIPRTTWFQRVSTRSSSTTYTNFNVSGAQAADAAGKAANQAPVNFRGVVMWDCTINDAARNATTNTFTGFQSGLLTWLLIRRASGKFEAESYATETGTWSAVSDGYASGGAARQTTAQNAKQSYAVSGTTKWFLLVAGGTTSAMATVNVDIDGGTATSYNLANQYAATINNGGRTWFPYAIQVTLPDTGAHTINITKTDATTNPLIVDALYMLSGTPPLIILNKAIYTAAGASNATVDTYNAAITTVANSVTTDGTIIITDPQAAGFTQATMTADGLHPNNIGAAFIATLVRNAIAAMTPSQSLAVRLSPNYNGPTPVTGGVAAPSAPAVISDNFNRANSTTTLGSASTGQAWTAIRGTWGVTSNAAYNVTHADDDVVLINAGTGKNDQRVTCKVTPAAGLIVRSDSTQANCYMWYISNGGGTLYKRVSGSYNNIGTVSGTINPGDTCEMQIAGTAITIRVNGLQIYSGTDSTITTGTYSGMRSAGDGGAIWDDFNLY